MRSLLRPRTAEGAAALGALVLTISVGIALAAAPPRVRPVIAAATAGAACTFVALAAAVARRRGDTRHAERRLAQAEKAVDESWFTADVLEGFPMEAVRPLLLGPDAPSLNRLYTVWVFATDGRDAAWLERHLDLPADVVHLLVEAARQRR